MYPTGYPTNTPYQTGSSPPNMEAPSLAEAVCNGMNVTGMRLPSSPGQFEGVYMDMGAIGANMSESSPQNGYSPTALWDVEFTSELSKHVKQEASDTEWGDGANSMISEQDSPPKPRRGRLPMNDEKLSPYERQKKERRREQNRRAARKCREKRKMHQDNIITDYHRLQTENAQLRKENVRIENERQRLAELLRTHERSCSFRPDTTRHYNNHTCSTSSIDTNDQMLSDEITDFVFEASSL